MLIDFSEIYVVQTRLAQPGQAPAEWQDVRQFDEEGPAFDWADYMREDGETEARVVRRWH